MHSLQQCTFVPTRVFPVGWDPLHPFLRKKEKEECAVKYMDRGNGPTGREMKRSNYEEEMKCWSRGWTGQSFASEGKAAVNQHFPGSRLHSSGSSIL